MLSKYNSPTYKPSSPHILTLSHNSPVFLYPSLPYYIIYVNKAFFYKYQPSVLRWLLSMTFVLRVHLVYLEWCTCQVFYLQYQHNTGNTYLYINHSSFFLICSILFGEIQFCWCIVVAS